MSIRSLCRLRSALALATCWVSLHAGAATVTVTSTADNTTVDGACTLREAILAVNAGTGNADCPASGTAWGSNDTIAFNISGSGVKVIQPTSGYAPFTRTVYINGYTQPGASANTIAAGAYPNATGVNTKIIIEIDGANAGNVDALTFNSGSISSAVSGLSIVNFQGNGVAIGTAAPSVAVGGNFLGWHADGTTRGANFRGVYTSAFHTLIGGASPAQRNLMLGRGESAVGANNAGNLTVRGNLIGVDKNGTQGGAVTAGTGVSLTELTLPNVQDNVIANHSGDGVYLYGVLSATLVGNTIGEGVGGVPQGNAGRGIFLGNGQIVATNGNSIHDNGITGSIVGIMALGDATNGDPIGNRLDNNAIYGNSALGIDLRPVGEVGSKVTPNDPLDADTGPNGLQNFPVITAAKVNANGSIRVDFTLDSKPNTTFYVSAYANPTCHAKGNGEGRYYGANAPVSSNGNGHATGTITVPTPLPVGWNAGAFVALLAHESVDGTSEFSACAQVVAAPGAGTPPVMGDVPNQNGTVGTAFNLNLAPYVTPTDGDIVSDWAYTGTLPPGLSFNNGLISGTPTQAGTFTIQVRAGDKDGWSSYDTIMFTIAAANAGNTAGVVASPALSEWARLLLAVVMCIAGFAALRAKRA